MSGRLWTAAAIDRLTEWASGFDGLINEWDQIAAELGRTSGSCKTVWARIRAGEISLEPAPPPVKAPPFLDFSQEREDRQMRGVYYSAMKQEPPMPDASNDLSRDDKICLELRDGNIRDYMTDEIHDCRYREMLEEQRDGLEVAA